MRRSLATAIEHRGVGLHGGAECRAVVRPAAPGHGLRLNGVPLSLERVETADHATQICTPAGPVRMVEHLLAALYAHRIDDAAIEVEGGEVPICDGSALPWIPARVVEQPGEPTILRPGPLELREGESWARVTPAPALQLVVQVDFPGLGPQRSEHAPLEVLGARTFGFLRDEAPLRAAGLIVGVSLDNTLVLDDAGHPVAPQSLRFPDEPARHKALDLLGDLALLNARLRARVEVHRGGHAFHHRLAALISAAPPCDMTADPTRSGL